MADKRPLCLYGGFVKQLQPGDALVGAYNATDAGWIVNASGWLVATPGTVKLVDRTVTGSINPVTSGGIKLLDNNDAVVLQTSKGTASDWGFVGIGSACRPQSRLHINVKGSGIVYTQYTNDTTAHGVDQGFLTGINAAEQVVFNNQENSDMRFYTNNLHRMTIRAGGTASIANASMTLADIVTANITTASVGTASIGNVTMRNSAILFTDDVRARDSGGLWLREDSGTYGIQIKDTTGNVEVVASEVVLRGNASIDGNLVVGGTGAFGNSVTITADVQVAAGQKFYMDGGSDTYWTASNDIITGHVNSASVVQFKATMAHFTTNASVDNNLSVGGDLVVTGSLVVTASTLYLGDNQLGDAQTDTQILMGNVIVYNDAAANPMRVTGNASISGTGYVAGTFGVGGAVHLKSTASIDSTLDVGGAFVGRSTASIDTSITSPIGNFSTSITALTASITTASLGTTTMTNGAFLFTDKVSARDSGGLWLTEVGGVGVKIANTSGDVILGSATGTPGARLHVFDSGDNSVMMVESGDAKANILLADGTTSNSNYIQVQGDVFRIYANSLKAWTTTGALNTASCESLFLADVNVRTNASIDGTLDVGGVVTHDTTTTLTGITTANANVVVNATVLASAVIIGGAGKARLVNCTINASGVITADGGTDLMLNQHDDTSPNQEFIAEKVWNAVYNDVVDWQDLKEGAEVAYGKVYVDSYDGAFIPTRRCQQGVMGICSDTFGFAVGRIQDRNQIPVSVAGWCLAYVDKTYETGVPLTNTSSGCLTEMNASEKMANPERLVALYKRPEHEEVWQGRVEVKGRHWVQVK